MRLTGESARPQLTADQASFIKNRCRLRARDEPDFAYLDYGIDERQQ
jgi:hypothetical protein